MSTEHHGNILNEITREEHDGLNNAKRVTLVGNVSITAVSQMTVTPQQAWPDPKGFIGLVTAVGTFTTSFAGNVTLDPGSKTGIVGNVTLSDSKGFIGLTTVTGSALDIRSLNSSATIFAVVNSSTNTGNVTLNSSPNFIGIVTVANPGSFVGNVTLDAGSKTGIVGNVTISDSKGFIGLTTVTGSALDIRSLNSTATLYAVVNTSAAGQSSIVLDTGVRYIGLATVDIGAQNGVAVKGNVTITDSKGFIGLVSIGGGILNTVTAVTDITNPIAIKGNVTLSGSPSVQSFGQFFPVLQSIASGGLGPIALDNFGRVHAKLTADPNTYIGLVTVDIGTNNSVAVKGNVTISDSKGFIGLTTAVVGSIAPGTAASNLGKAEDAAHTSGDVGVMMLGVINQDGDSLFNTTDGDYAAVSTNKYAEVRVVGGLSHDFPDSAHYAPVKIGGRAQATLPTAVALDGNMVNAWLDLNGRQMVSFGAAGNVTLTDSKGFIGLVTVVQSSTSRSIVGNVTLSDSKTFIGLVTVKASVLDTFSSLATFTMSIASLATSITNVGRQSTLIDNTTTRYTSANVYLKVFTGGLAHTPNTLINVHLLRRDNNSVGDDGAGASDAAGTFVNAPLLGSILVNASNVSTAYYGVFDTSTLGPLGPQWGIGLVNQTGAALGGTESNHLKNWIGINKNLT